LTLDFSDEYMTPMLEFAGAYLGKCGLYTGNVGWHVISRLNFAQLIVSNRLVFVVSCNFWGNSTIVVRKKLPFAPEVFIRDLMLKKFDDLFLSGLDVLNNNRRILEVNLTDGIEKLVPDPCLEAPHDCNPPFVEALLPENLKLLMDPFQKTSCDRPSLDPLESTRNVLVSPKDDCSQDFEVDINSFVADDDFDGLQPHLTIGFLLKTQTIAQNFR
jgi:hypothetical protein